MLGRTHAGPIRQVYQTLVTQLLPLNWEFTPKSTGSRFIEHINGLSVCFQTHGEEVLGPQRTYRKHRTSGGIWKTRVLFFVYGLNRLWQLVFLVQTSFIFFGNVLFAALSKRDFFNFTHRLENPKNWCKSESSRTSFISKGLIQASTPRM